MGLDMYFETFSLNATEEFLNTRENNLTQEEKERKEVMHKLSSQLAYFRKHCDLHGWLTDKWHEKHPETVGTDFNTTYMEITPELLKEMTAYARKKHPYSEYNGFFWGDSTPDDWKETRKLCKEIRAILKSGLGRVFYYSWW